MLFSFTNLIQDKATMFPLHLSQCLQRDLNSVKLMNRPCCFTNMEESIPGREQASDGEPSGMMSTCMGNKIKSNGIEIW